MTIPFLENEEYFFFPLRKGRIKFGWYLRLLKMVDGKVGGVCFNEVGGCGLETV